MTARPAPLLPHLDPATPLAFGLRYGGQGVVTEMSAGGADLLSRLPQKLVREAVAGATAYDVVPSDYLVHVNFNGPWPQADLVLRPLGDGAYRAELPGERPAFDVSIALGADPAEVARQLRALAKAITAEAAL
ncbi:hypothetical protein [Pseudofrankia sp. BMG5.37]|uniref:hypothetical protein n=1 Tax=Pseudofrankia sp. BMG5.37 TaxID=3050035 RepID=UPI002893B2CD|nr:hypothetical protein [Pseudofrankia sp. BMG5.37]MDT3438352.1 hypothetical protein [Pseudofrankia sp. BMG5.37]